MYQAFKNAGQNVKVILHQNAHYHYYGKDLNGELSNEVINKWLCHYLYDVDNGIESLPEITVQSNTDGSFTTRDSWNDLPLTAYRPENQTGENTVKSRNLDAAAAVLVKNALLDVQYYRDLTGEEAAVYEIPVPEGSLISGTPEVHVRLSTEDTDQDNLMVTALLMDEMKDGSPFEAYCPKPEMSTRVPEKTVGKYVFGEGHPEGSITEFVRSYTRCKAFSFGWIDLLDPGAEKFPTLDTKWHTAKTGEYSDYTIVLTPTEYQLEEGHVLKLYIFAQDPARTREDDSQPGYVSMTKTDEVYSFKIDLPGGAYPFYR